MKLVSLVAAAGLFAAAAPAAAVTFVRYQLATTSGGIAATFVLTATGFLRPTGSLQPLEVTNCRVTRPRNTLCVSPIEYFVDNYGNDSFLLTTRTRTRTFPPVVFRFSGGAIGQFGTFTASDATLVISEASAPAGGVPEPASRAMLITGFGLTGAALRRCRTASVAPAA